MLLETLGCYWVCVCARVSVWDLTWKWLVKSHKQEALKCQKQKYTLPETHTKAGYGDVVCISIFECIPASYTNTHPYVHRAVVVCAVVQAVLPLCVCVRARLSWSGRSSTSRLACLFFIKMPLTFTAEESGAAGGIFSLFPFLSFSRPLQLPLHESFPLFLVSCIYLCIFFLYILTISWPCNLYLTFFCLFLAWFTKLINFPNVPGASLFTKHKTHESFLFVIRQASEWHCWGLQWPTVHFSSTQMINDEKQNCVFFFVTDTPELSSNENNLEGERSLSSRCSANTCTSIFPYSHPHIKEMLGN